MHDQALAFYAEHLSELDPKTVVEFGSCDMNGTVRSVYPQAASWLGIDVQPGRGVDLIADAATWETDDRYDIVICAEAFEHTPDWRDIIDTAHTVLVPGGLFLASCATGTRPPHSAIDGGHLRAGEFYENVDPGLMRMALYLDGWTEIDVVEADGYFGGDDLYIRCVK